MLRLLWVAVLVLILALAGGILLLDRRQVTQGVPSLFAPPWSRARAPAAARGAGRAGSSPARPPDTPRRQVALLVDELGARRDVFEEVVALGRPLSVGVLPELPLSRQIARDARLAGLEVLLQLPLEPYGFPAVDPGPGVLLVAMSPGEVTRRTRQYLARLPEATGVATGMGSRFTEDRLRMRALLEAVSGEGRFFVDARTSQAGVGYDLARALGVPAARRQIFLDPGAEEETVWTQLALVEAPAARRGDLVAIAHGRPLTLRLLAAALPRWEARGLSVVPVSRLVDGAP